MDAKELQQIINEYKSSREYNNLESYDSYYNTKNSELYNKWRDRENRNINPNWAIPTAYYPTIVDTMAGYLMSNVVYESKDKTLQEEINLLMKNILDGSTDNLYT